MRTAIARNVVVGLAAVMLGFASGRGAGPGSGMGAAVCPAAAPMEQALGAGHGGALVEQSAHD